MTVDTITHDPQVLAMLVERMGVARVAMGTDLPFDMAPPDPVGELIAAVGEETAQTVHGIDPGLAVRHRLNSPAGEGRHRQCRYRR